MAEPKAKGFKLTALGCGLLILAVIVLLGVMARSVSERYGRALAVRETLERKYPGLSEFKPDLGGGIHPDRMWRFFSVRRDLLNYLPLVRPGGLVVLHDCVEDGLHPGVWRAYQAELAPRSVEIDRAESLLVTRLPDGE